ncbi:hypothetical protein CKAN_02578600 [Cinnamomum micranthum f. kanehirae]|uniref:Uncharacterized protein n=1 Tax=Cinnamomum micranthum f. kanehirae TaxID=337451 RepID=A0A443Q040_9MAGN|nr:hypothetical protein CKAN_02578600 [Cinnamomum micranthum f. kanehirae]
MNVCAPTSWSLQPRAEDLRLLVSRRWNSVHVEAAVKSSRTRLLMADLSARLGELLFRIPLWKTSSTFRKSLWSFTINIRNGSSINQSGFLYILMQECHCLCPFLPIEPFKIYHWDSHIQLHSMLLGDLENGEGCCMGIQVQGSWVGFFLISMIDRFPHRFIAAESVVSLVAIVFVIYSHRECNKTDRIE